MTLYGWDASHFDGLLSRAILARVQTEGFTFFTHKIAEGLSDTEGGNDDTALAAARDAGIEFIGGYLIPRSNASVTTQVNTWLDIANKGEPWWRDFPGWFWQIDLERWPYDAVPAGVGIAAAQQLRERTGRLVVLYASRGQYGNQLSAWDGPLWNADYVSNQAGYASVLYPGDDWTPGWAPYSGQAPTILQFTSSATIAGLTTCDANAYRGTVEELRALVTGATKGTSMTLAPNELDLIEQSTSVLGDAYAHSAKAGDDPVKSIGTQVAELYDALVRHSTPATTAGAPTQDQVNAAMLNALQNPDVVAALGAAIASHIHVS